MRVAPAFVGARMADSDAFSQGGTAAQASALATSGIDGVFGYLGAFTVARRDFVLGAGMAFAVVTFGGRYDGDDTVAQCKALSLPQGADVWLDHEGLAVFHTPPATSIALITSWSSHVLSNGWIPKLYVGAPQNLTSEELWDLPVTGYWRGQGSMRDRTGNLAEPGLFPFPIIDAAGNLAEPSGAGWQITQMYPSRLWGGVNIDVNMVGQDYKGRTLHWVTS